MRDSGKGSQEEAEPEAGRAERWGRSSAGREVGWACLPALIGRAEDFEVDPKSSMKRLRSFKQKQTVIGFP